MSLNPEWLSSIQDPGIYPHPVSEIRLMETHISWVILTGDWAYKLKKPVNFGFVDFSTLDLRHAACLEEVRLNRRTAPLLYDGVVPLAKGVSGPQFGGAGPVLEYAVRMRQFAQEDLLEQCLVRHELTTEVVDTLARAIADLHLHAAIASSSSLYATPDVIRENVQRCLEQLGRESLPQGLRTELTSLEQWVNAEWERLNATFILRKEQGWVRECHGDLHLGNLVRYRGKPTLFDCLEFNPGLRWIDVMSDIAFLIMDLCDKGAAPLAWRALNEWIEQTGDYGGLDVLRYYLVYRALVRAKVAAIRLAQPDVTLSEQKHQHELLESYLKLALTWTRRSPPAMILMHGVSGSGKSFVARKLVASIEAIQIRSDVERKRLREATPKSSEPSPRGIDLYSTEAVHRTYQRLQSLARKVIAAGYPVIIDATFSKQSDRADFAAIADELSVPFLVVSCVAPEHVLLQRVMDRQRLGGDASDADIDVLKTQMSTTEPLTSTESDSAMKLNTTSEQLPEVVRWISHRIGRGTLE